MRILFLLHSAGAKEGSSIAAVAIISQLKAYGHDICAVLPKDGELNNKLTAIGVSTIIVPYSSSLYPKVYTLKSLFSWPQRFFKLLWINHIAESRLKQVAKIYNPDIIHTNVGVLSVGYYVARALGIPHVWHIRETEVGLNLHHYPSYRFQRKLFNTNCSNIAVTENVKQYYKLDSKNTKIIYDGVFSSSYTPSFDIDKKRDYFLFVGRVSLSKGADWAVQAFMNIADKNPVVELWLAGPNTSSFAKKLIEDVKAHSVASRVKFLGERDDIYELMSKAKAVLVPSVLEGFGFITVEAMLNRSIVIGRNTGGTKEQFDNGLKMTGQEIALRAETIDDMSRHMSEICQHGQEHYKEMVDAAERVVRQIYTIENNTKMILEIYNNLMSR